MFTILITKQPKLTIYNVCCPSLVRPQTSILCRPNWVGKLVLWVTFFRYTSKETQLGHEEKYIFTSLACEFQVV